MLQADGCAGFDKVYESERNGIKNPFRGQGLRMVFSNPNFATAFDTEGSEPYGLLR
jgi:hypothetical protein